jgi:hypothetical protein
MLGTAAQDRQSLPYELIMPRGCTVGLTDGLYREFAGMVGVHMTKWRNFRWSRQLKAVKGITWAAHNHPLLT